jgi:ParB family chromosome partitioning protein
MMAKASKNSAETYGAAGRTNLLLFDPDKLKLVTDKKHHLYDPRVENDPDDSLIASIVFKGVIEPVIVWKDPETGETVVVDGRQRVKAAREANKRLKKEGRPVRLVKAIVTRGDSKSLMAEMVIANEGRTDVTAIGRAKMAQRLLEAGHDEGTIAIILHCSVSGLKNYIALLDCPAAVRDAVEKGQIPATQAYKLSKLEPTKAKATLGKMLKAAEGAKGKHARAKKMRAATGDKHRSWTEIIALRETLDSRDDEEARNWLSALDWCLGKSESSPASADGGEAAE